MTLGKIFPIGREVVYFHKSLPGDATLPWREIVPHGDDLPLKEIELIVNLTVPMMDEGLTEGVFEAIVRAKEPVHE